MRFEHLSLRIPGDEFRLRFHERLTVVSGIGVLERRALVDSLFSSITGGPESTELAYVDAHGRRVTVTCEKGRMTCAYDDGSPAPSVPDLLGRDADALRDLMLLTPADLGLQATARAGEPAELAEARATLAALTEELHSAYSARQAVEAMREELASIDERIRVWEETKARRQYARLLADLERVRAEASALRSGRTGADADRHLITSADEARRLAVAWRSATDEAAELAAELGDVERLDPRTLRETASAPAEVPADIDRLVTELERAEAARLELSTRLRDVAASRLPEPSHPAVAELARRDQDALWATNERVLTTAAAVDVQSYALGGLAADGDADSPELLDALERHHDEVVQAEEQIERSRKTGLLSSGGGVAAAAAAAAVAPIAAPVVLAGAAGAAAWHLVRPKRRLSKALEKEQQSLQQVGAPTYLSFHMRRVDAIIDPNARERLELAAMEHRVALSAWHEVAGDLDPVAAAQLRDEVTAYAASLRDLGNAAEEIEALRRELVERAEPAAEAARAALMDVCVPFGVDDPFLASELVRHQVETGRIARVQLALETAEATAARLHDDLDGTLRNLGFAEGELSARVGAFEWAYSRAVERERSRASARDVAEVEAELAKLEDEAKRSRRPEWATVSVAEADEPDVDELITRRDALAASYTAARNLVPDVERLADRHGALERRVSVLEAAGGGPEGDDGVDADAVRQYLLAHLTQANSGGPDGDAVPIVVDEALVRLQGDTKWELLDLLERVGDRAQLIYLTDDPYVGAWARRRAAAGAMSLLEPVAEPV